FGASDGGGSPDGVWTPNTSALLDETTLDAVNTVHVWAADSRGNIGASVADTIIVLSSGGDYDLDGLVNTSETSVGASPLDADTDDDQMDDGWEYTYGLVLTNGSDATLDPDGDGYDNRGEYVCDTDPGSGSSFLDFRGGRWSSGTGILMEWGGSADRLYSLYSKGSLASAWEPVAGWVNHAGADGTMSYTGSTAGIDFQIYRLEVIKP
ncbi:MAG: hypothetical protein JXB46_09740, partial [Candidatus Eisenbacteria bacterium]|nr:hypothetical protein [Candidatus Eisenbacteria bacterium]